MKTITFLPPKNDAAPLKRALKLLSLHTEFEQTHTLDEFIVRLVQLQPVGTVAVVEVDNLKALDKLAAHEQVLDRYRLILILDTSNHELIERAHQLHPRVVVDLEAAAAQIPQILLHMQRQSAPISPTKGRRSQFHVGN